ncbi:HAD family hydrolase [Arhodomonas sp. AD133]|uniref:HAD family hydrolase n=1 Tax=Arhodomonas sp. AD133 TaxID=3415009 RepID=UPI003EBAF45F
MTTERETPPAIVFDLGGVLVDWNPRHLYRKLFDDTEEMEWFLAEVCSPAWNLRQDAGRPFADAIREKQAQYPRYASAISAYFDRWPEMLGGLHADTLAVLRDVRASGAPLYALTNWSHETFPVARARYEFLDWFRGIVVSGEAGLVKPDPRIYRCLLDRYGVTPVGTVFIDDSPANVEAARDLGMTGIHFAGAADLRGELQALGVLQ